MRNRKIATNFLPYWIFSLLLIFRFWLATGIPKRYVYGPHDDLFYAKAAHYLIHGQWMGPYDQLTLIKGPFYAFFLVGSYATGLPLYLNETLFYMAACIFMVIAIRPLAINRWWKLGLLTILLFSPISLSTEWTLRVYREFVYLSVSLFLLAFSIGFYLRIKGSVHNLVLWGIGYGITLGAFQLSREEGVWIYPITAFVVAMSVILIIREKLDQRLIRIISTIIPVVIMVVCIQLVSYKNYTKYGIWGFSENLDTNLNRVVNTIFRIQTSDWKPYKSVTIDVIHQAESVSPAFAELAPSMISDWDSWMYWSDRALQAKPKWYLEQYFSEGKGLAGGHFLWAFRSSLESAGYYDSGRFPSDYLDKMATELETACDDGRLDCLSESNIPLIGSLTKEQFPLIFRFFFDDLARLIQYDVTGVTVADMNLVTWHPYQKEFALFEEFAYNPINYQLFGATQENPYLVKNKIDLRVKAIEFKQGVMKWIEELYKVTSVPVFVLWVIFILITLWRKRAKLKFNVFDPIIFALITAVGYFISRLGTLAVVDATTSVPAIHYIISEYVYMYVILVLVVASLATRPETKDTDQNYKIELPDMLTRKSDLSR